MQNYIRTTSLFVLLCSVFIAYQTPTVAAYTSTNQTTIQLSEQRALFLVQFAFGTRFNDFYIPIQALRGEQYGSERDVVGYDIVADRAGVSDDGTTRSLVISNLELVDNAFYRIPAGQNGFFTLVTELTLPDNIPDSEYLLQVTSLPHYVGSDQDRRTVNEVELRTFITPGVDLNLP